MDREHLYGIYDIQDDEVEEILTRPRESKPWHVPDEKIKEPSVLGKKLGSVWPKRS